MTTRRMDGTLGPDLVVHGRLTGKSESLRIDGVFEGEVDVEGNVIVGPDGVVTAGCRVGSLDVEGEVRGDVTALGAVSIRAGGRVLGDVRARRLAIDDGGSLQGGIEMDFDLPDADALLPGERR